MEMLVRWGIRVSSWFVLLRYDMDLLYELNKWRKPNLKVVSPFQIVGINLILRNLRILVFVSEEPAMTTALKSAMVGVHVTSHVRSFPANFLSISCHVRPWLLFTVIFSKLEGHIIHVGQVVSLQCWANTCLGNKMCLSKKLQYFNTWSRVGSNVNVEPVLDL